METVNGKNESNIVVTFATYPRQVRDFLREQIKESTGQDLIFILLQVSEEEYLKIAISAISIMKTWKSWVNTLKAN